MADTPKSLVTGGNKLQNYFSGAEIDLDHLSPEVRAEIQKYAAMKGVDFMKSVAELQRDLNATSVGMITVADVVRKMSESGDSVTVQQEINNSAGKIKIIAGNTAEAKKGLGSEVPWQYVIGGIVLAIIVAAILSNN